MSITSEQVAHADLVGGKKTTKHKHNAFAGTSFPVSPEAGEHFHRTDLGELFSWDEGRNKWLGELVHIGDLASGSAAFELDGDDDLMPMLANDQANATYLELDSEGDLVPRTGSGIIAYLEIDGDGDVGPRSEYASKGVYMPFDATITGLTWVQDVAIACDIQVRRGTSIISTTETGVTASGGDMDMDADFNAGGVCSVWSSVNNYPQVNIYWRRRAT